MGSLRVLLAKFLTLSTAGFTATFSGCVSMIRFTQFQEVYKYKMASVQCLNSSVLMKGLCFWLM